MDGDTEAHADEAGCSSYWPVGQLLHHCRAAPASGRAWWAEEKAVKYCPLSCRLCGKEGNCSGRNLCFNMFFFVCLKQVPTSLRKPCPTFPRKYRGRFFLLHLLFTFLPSFFFLFFNSFFPALLFLSFLPLSLTLLCTCFLKNIVFIF